jgi:methylenetetrahydrofolate--tRNA-(uracil-5-)-methyltransferase
VRMDAGGSSGRAVVVVGGGLAGSEAAWQAAAAGAQVTLFEMRPGKTTEAHRTGLLAELVCSNSFKSDALDNANGLLKSELGMLGSLLVRTALETRVPAGSALCVDRQRFAAAVSAAVEQCPGIRMVREEATRIPTDAVAVLAPGPLASESIAAALEDLVGAPNLFFYDAVSPIVEADSIDMSKAFTSSRYGKGEPTYINLPLDRDQYARLVEDLGRARALPKRDFEDAGFFSACMPIEEVAAAGRETLAHGCLKPVGLADPRTGRIPHAVVQLRPENLEGTMHSMVGFQTRLTYPEQQRIFRALPGLEAARFVRLGSMHRNTYIRGPAILSPTLEHRSRTGVFLAGQITGAEGYMAAAATGLVAGINAARAAAGADRLVPPPQTVVGGLARYVSQAGAADFRPINPNFGLLPPLADRVRDRRRRNLALSKRSAEALEAWIAENHLGRGCGRTVDHSGVVS